MLNWLIDVLGFGTLTDIQSIIVLVGAVVLVIFIVVEILNCLTSVFRTR